MAVAMSEKYQTVPFLPCLLVEVAEGNLVFEAMRSL
jgi:hypothetical protein